MDVDTLNIPYTMLIYIWGSSPTDVWAVGPGGDLDKTIYHFTGEKWLNDGISRSLSPGAVFGFSQNDVWFGSTDAFWHYNGNSLSRFQNYSIPDYPISGIQGMWGNSPSNIYAVGYASDQFTSPTLTTTFVQHAKIKCVVTDSKGLSGTSNIIDIGVTNGKEAGKPYGNAASGNLVSERSSEIAAVSSYKLEQNSPNPFNPSTIISYQLPNDRFVSLKVYDMLGREVMTLVNEIKSRGKYSISFDASKLASGIYIYQLKANGFSSIKKMILTK